MSKQQTVNRKQQNARMNRSLFTACGESVGSVHCSLPQERGFTLLLASLISSVVLALGIAIWGIASKQVTLSSMGRDSQFAFYAADTGAECALYWDIRDDVHPNTFATSTVSSPAATVSCNNTEPMPPVSVISGSDYHATSEFQFEPNGYCTKVRVTKCRGKFTIGTCTREDPPTIRTLIHADGYNVVCDSIDSSPRVLQRSVELHY